MKYRYAYKTSDGVRHEDSMNASSREEVFKALREKGIKAIKVVAADGSKANGEIRGVRKRVVAVLAFSAATIAALAVWSVSHHAKRDEVKGSVCVATPLARQIIAGDRSRIENLPTDMFKSPAEFYLAHFAEPGRFVGQLPLPSEEALVASLDIPITYIETDFTEQIDLKRIVVQLKLEAKRYINGGGTVKGYLQELSRRQNLELAHRAKCVQHLQKLINEGSPSAAYDYWLKANAVLKSMGIYTIDLPNELQEQQLNIDLDGL